MMEGEEPVAVALLGHSLMARPQTSWCLEKAPAP